MNRLALSVATFVALAACASSDPVVDRETVVVAQDSTGDTAPPSIVLETVGVQPEGFTTATVEIIKADGTICEVCMWLADTAEERSRGLMGVTDLGTAAGMAFVFEQPTSGSFYMFQTVTPLSIGWFAPGGALVSMADMAPCESNDSSQCDRFPAGAEFDLAIEVFQGDLAAVGVEPGSSARVIKATEAEACPADSAL
ncbi:MAG: uncharacterized membrane protein (UPF0127 family) [Ilumatobacter sp.]